MGLIRRSRIRLVRIIFRMTPSRRLWLFLPAGLLFAFDVAITLHGQPAAYWAGDTAGANEANPIAYPLLAASPWLFVGLAALWLAVLGAVIVKWTSRWSHALAMGIAFAHALGGASWLLRSGDWGLAFAGVYLVFAAQFSIWCWGKGG